MDRGPDDAALVQTFYEGWRRLAAVIAPLEVEPDDLVQEALARTLQKRSLFELDDPDRYIRVVMVRLAANERRHLGVTRRWRQQQRDTSSVRDAYPSDVADLCRLSPKVRAVLFLVEVEGWQFAEVAAVLGCSEEAARARAARGRHELRRALIVEER